MVLGVIAIFVVVFATHAVTYALSDSVQIKLRQHTFLIPKQYSLETGAMPEWLSTMSGLDDGSNSTLFRFDDKEIKDSVPGYQVSSDNQFVDDIEVLMMALTPEGVKNYRNPEIYRELGDLWRATGSYKNRKVEPAEDLDLYKVYREVEYPRSWSLLNRFPDPEKAVPEEVSDFWIAHCLLLGPTGKKSASCDTYELMDDIVLTFSVSDYNLPLLDELKNFVKSKVREWKQI